jgi:hypothetical protein
MKCVQNINKININDEIQEKSVTTIIQSYSQHA